MSSENAALPPFVKYDCIENKDRVDFGEATTIRTELLIADKISFFREILNDQKSIK